ncbi:uncharacterized protein AC631_00198 [Debaryomyces fabryi]|uniref:Uncharacterized protein n=1 Tax=Debaryomyces fabryi TaxID=58627 RepID=A0A0V1Q6N7_9ASCO|nr:uncharacterized protein AC631_00198 [Debaryomyces fabryi]KSA04119.1 hypothetical protein AC631_00198 [Debaryomyces fabryi]CUM50088.1 unnamed protein product [Debaryomyces fabryi]
MSIPSNNSTTSLESTSIPGLSTPQVNNSEFDNTKSQDATNLFTTTVIHKDGLEDPDVSINNGKVVSVFDVALDLEDKLNEILQQIDNADKEINDRMDKVASRLTALEQKVSQAS